MSTENNSFAVHLASLVDFARELGTQLTGMAQPLAHLGGLTEREVQLGQFTEADLLGAHHLAAAEEMHALLGRAGQAIDFAEDVTHTIAEAYRRQDQQAGQALVNLGNVLQISDPRTDPGRL
ncbi:hypothetical protein N8J89_22385 [Crossiella sp. CA-258035]|uniref:hypothetical protein n=1 Tax=Crossiella sp. CA-258035 TaxID=2981138 RepID=UPI0024BC2080|nr:hypothetical protein [Crossiella sp. CA-258035]WHT15880.1 hypothetical protein N8J89_22385 [Crossiella sp. CA-258035]